MGFFGLREEDRPHIFQSVFDLVYHGGGGFTYSEVYNMPIWLRKYNLIKVQEAIKTQNNANNPNKPTGQDLQRMPDEVKKVMSRSGISIKSENMDKKPK